MVRNINIGPELRLAAGSGCDGFGSFRFNSGETINDGYVCVYCRMIHQLIGSCGKKITIDHYGDTNTRCFVTLFTENLLPTWRVAQIWHVSCLGL